MSRYARRPLTLQELWMEGQPVTLSDLVAITGWSRDSLIASIESGDLQAMRRHPSASYRIIRTEARRWLTKCGMQQAGSGLLCIDCITRMRS